MSDYPFCLNRQKLQVLVGEICVDYKPRTRPSTSIASSKDADTELRMLFNRIAYKEEFYAVFVNRANQTLGWSKISEGGTAGTVVDFKILFQHALIVHASGILVGHNHPSGNLSPSNVDIKLTKRLQEACQIMGFNLLDHLILTNAGYRSFRDEGWV